VQQLEQEVKLEVDPGWTVPDLSGLFPGVRAVPLPTLALETVYYDTADSRLARHHVALRFRREATTGRAGGQHHERRAEWTIKLPSAAPTDGTVLVRTEVTWPVALSGRAPGTAGRARPGEGGRSGRPRPPRALPAAAQFLRAVTLDLPLVTVARLETTRERTELLTSDGRKLAEIDHDDVRGRRLVRTGSTPAGTGGRARPGPEVHFVEVEAELAEGSAQEVLEAVVARLLRAGARSSSRQSKLSTVLGMATPAAPAAGGVVSLPPGPRAGAAPALMSDVLAEQARACLDALVDHDPAIRLGDPDPEHVHQARVGARRLRSILRSFAPLVATPRGEVDDRPENWFAGLREELRWLGAALGDVRDADVRLQGLVQECSALPPAYNLGAAALLAAAEDDQRAARQALLEDMATERYVELLRSLEKLGGGPAAAPSAGPRPGTTGAGTTEEGAPAGLWTVLGQPASTGMAALAGRQWRAVRKTVDRLGDDPSAAALHGVRIQAKRLRYVSEVAAALVAPASHRKEAKCTAKAAAALQDVLGALHDATVAEQWLRDSLTRLPDRTKATAVFATGLAAGQLVARAQDRQEALRKKWPAAWAPLKSHRLHRWVEA
jgi:CHAD domain-containing protein